MLTLSGLVEENPALPAPMAGVTDRPFRDLLYRLGTSVRLTEMIASEALVRNHGHTREMIDRRKEPGSIGVQIFGARPEVMAEAAVIVADHGADFIDINMGCPVRKIVGTGAGAALMRTPEKAGGIVEQVVRSVKVPVSVKMRTGWRAEENTAVDLARRCEQAGAELITVHGRSRAAMYGGKADLEKVAAVKDAVSVPLIANGDINSPETARHALHLSGADGVMIGRGIMGAPWRCGRISADLKGERLPEPHRMARRDIALSHFEALLSEYGTTRGLHTARKHLCWYAHGLRDAANFRARINREESPESVRKAIHACFNGTFSRQEEPNDTRLPAR